MESTRIDKWLWAARFFKTRSLAADAVKGGRVQLNGVRVKASKDVCVDDEVEVTIGQTSRVVIVRGISERRGPAVEAQALYRETARASPRARPRPRCAGCSRRRRAPTSACARRSATVGGWTRRAAPGDESSHVPLPQRIGSLAPHRARIERRPTMGQPVVHFEIIGTDGAKLREYYGELFGWAFNADNPMNYGTVARADNLNADGIGIGGGVAGYADAPNSVTFYVQVPDVEAALVQAESLGGKRLMGPVEPTPEITIGQFADPEGNVIGVVNSAM